MPNAFGFDIGGSSVKFGIVNEKGEILYSDKREFKDKNLKSIKQVLKKSYEELTKKKHSKPYAIGIGLPGCINRETATVTGGADNISSLNGVNIKNIFSNYKIHVAIDNDANCAAIAEKHFGAARKFKNFVLITLGTGIGAGVYLNNEIYRGHYNYAGEPGHMTIIPDGKKCECGKKGCLESYISSKALLKAVNDNADYKNSNLSIETIFEKYKSNDKKIKSIINEAFNYLGIGISHIVNLLNPEAVIIGGGLSHFYNHFSEIVKQSINKNSLPLSSQKFTLSCSKLKNEAGFIGAAVQALNSAAL